MLDAHIELRLGDLDLDLDLTVGSGETVALLGPNGAGKTTTLRALAGLQPIDRGLIALDGAVLDDPSTGVFVPTASRPIGVVFQDYLLFPRLTVLDNVAFGLRSRGGSRRASREAAQVWLHRLGLAEHATATPRELSGGQAQRVALARTLATEPTLLLLDEPLAALDASSRRRVRAELGRHLAGFDGIRIIVTHDPVDALVLADRLVIIEQGRAVQAGLPAEITARPASRYVADLIGTNLVHATADGTNVLRLDNGSTLTVADPEPPGPVAIAIRPQDISLHRHPPEGSPRNNWATTVAGIEADHDRARITLGDPLPVTAEITAPALAELGLASGAPIWASVKAVELTVYAR